MHTLGKRQMRTEAANNANTVMVSYRGPNNGGGVSSALTELMRNEQNRITSWLYVDEGTVTASGGGIQRRLQLLSSLCLNGHYAFCNEYLWPLMHEFFSKVIFNSNDLKFYREFNQRVFEHSRGMNRGQVFVHDYQLALVPGLLKSQMPDRVVGVFWHIPWPEVDSEKQLPLLGEIARSLAKADCIGFHTDHYRQNFVQFASRFVEGYTGTNTVAAPLGVDKTAWQEAARCSLQPCREWFDHKRFVLSVDRADYTKGVLSRLSAIERFLEKSPEWLGKVVFVQHCCRTRPGLTQFDEYWMRCLKKVEELNSKSSPYEPIRWLSEPIEHEQSAALYRDADVILITPIKDGLNLTAKEFVSCRRWRSRGDCTFPRGRSLSGVG